ncbi:hypothetical protein CTI12_AA414530 [Artemisia annua]|uniref:Uncharacterized protein n=1 Tax=Artemisia annua TaxID=35608 RepID=A0A2U1M4R2_ARTAN|nr:hypothetical protein CTI12_AA414530 [Artemisia annua]
MVNGIRPVSPVVKIAPFNLCIPKLVHLDRIKKTKDTFRSSTKPKQKLTPKSTNNKNITDAEHGISLPNPLLPIQKLNAKTSTNYQRSHLTYRKISRTRPQFFLREGYGAKYAISVGGRNHDLSLHNGGNEPFWSVKSLFAILAEQPSQLKYIEWPGFQNTVKTATLTLVLVAMLIIVLSSVESGLWYLVALILRKPA